MNTLYLSVFCSSEDDTSPCQDIEESRKSLFSPPEILLKQQVGDTVCQLIFVLSLILSYLLERLRVNRFFL